MQRVSGLVVGPPLNFPCAEHCSHLGAASDQSSSRLPCRVEPLGQLVVVVEEASIVKSRAKELFRKFCCCDAAAQFCKAFELSKQQLRIFRTDIAASTLLDHSIEALTETLASSEAVFEAVKPIAASLAAMAALWKVLGPSDTWLCSKIFFMFSDAFWREFRKGMIYICLCFLAFLLAPNGIRVERTNTIICLPT